MKILLTGGAGFIGSILARDLLEWGHEVTVLDDLRMGGQGLLGVYGHPRFRLCKGDVGDDSLVRYALRKQEVVIHLAALVGEPACKKDPSETARINECATGQLVRRAKGAGCKQFIFASTCSNYGKVPGKLLAEADELMPLGLYAETKIAAEEEVLKFYDDDFAATVLRFATVYGVSPRMRFDLMINEFVRDAVVDGWLLIYGRESWRPFVHVRDIPDMFAMVLGRRKDAAGQIFNVGGDNHSKDQIVGCIKSRIRGLDVEYKEGKEDPRDYRVDFSKAAAFGFRPRYRPIDGIEEIINALRDGLFPDPHSSAYRNV